MEVERVQAIATMSWPQDMIPDAFVRSEREQPALTTYNGPDVPDIPTIDIGQEDEETVVKLIAEASKDWGIFQVVNHGIPDELIAKLQEVGRKFFELPAEEKEVYAKVPDAKSIEGYGSKLQKEVEGKKSWVDHLFHRIWPASSINYQFWPKNPPSYREVNKEYTKHVRRVTEKLFRLTSKGLGLENDMLEQACGGERLQYLMKINYYPPCPRPDLTLGVPQHTDLSAYTILVPNEVPGLQVFKDGHWIDVKYIPNALIVHVGDQIEILTNGKYKAVLHRTTVEKDKTRMSWPVFLEPPADLVVGPLPQLVKEDESPKYKAKKFEDYSYCKLNKLPQ